MSWIIGLSQNQRSQNNFPEIIVILRVRKTKLIMSILHTRLRFEYYISKCVCGVCVYELHHIISLPPTHINNMILKLV